MRVVLVEDNPGDIRLINECFRDNPYPQNFEVIDFATVAKTIQYLNNTELETIDAILLDLGLPDSVGLDTLKKIKVHAENIPIIVLTGLDDVEVGLQAVQEGAQDYLIKNQITGQFLGKSILYSIERKQVEKLKYKSLVAAEATQRKSDFVAMVSHEIRSPLGIIIGFAELLIQTNSKVKEETYAKKIRENAEHLNNLIHDLLDLARIEAGRIDLEKTLFDLKKELKSSCESLKQQINQKGLDFSLNIDGSAPTFVQTDSTRLRQIIYNLVGNAIKFTSNGGISIDVRAGDNEKIDIFVKDTGCGIQESDQSKLFQAFSQANSSVYAKHKGTGLGLVLSKQLARAMGGDLVLLESAPEKGTTFLLSLDSGLS